MLLLRRKEAFFAAEPAKKRMIFQIAGRTERISGILFSLTKNRTPNRTQHMPFYEYVCRKCNERFGEVLTIKEHETKKPHCPKCQSTDLEKVIEPFFAKTSSKTRG